MNLCLQNSTLPLLAGLLLLACFYSCSDPGIGNSRADAAASSTISSQRKTIDLLAQWDDQLQANLKAAGVNIRVRDGNSDLAVEAGGVALENPRDWRAILEAIRQVAGTADPERCRAVAEQYPRDRMFDEVVATLTG